MSRKKLERRNKILAELSFVDELSVDDMASKFSLTPATIRRDLADLELKGRIIRTHGGAMLNNDPTVIAHHFNERKSLMVTEKDQIAETVARMIQNGSSVMLDNGTTNWYLAKRLRNKTRLMVVTNSLSIMLEMTSANSDNDVVLAGGHYRRRNLDFVDANVSGFLATHFVDYAILTCDSYRPGQGFFKKNIESAVIAETICGCATNVIVLADYSKYQAKAIHLFADDLKVNQLYTTKGSRPIKPSPPYEIIYC